MMQRILHFAQDGDTSGFFPQLAKWHDRNRYQVFFATLNPMEPRLREYMESQGVRCFSCECKSRRQYPMGMIRLAQFMRRNRIGILHTHLFEPSLVGLSAGLLASTPIRVMTRHYSDYHTRIHKKWHTRLDQLCTRLSRGVIAVSEHTAKHLREVEGAPREKVYAVLNGIDFDRVSLSGRDDRERIRREFSIDDGFLLLVMARLHPEKGHHFLFEALCEVRKKADRRIRLLVAGVGPFEAAYKAEVLKLGLEDIVSFLGFRKDPAALIAAADLVILPSVAEAFGLVLTEALYIGTPVVATNVGGIPEIVDDRIDGALVPPADSGVLAERIIELLNDEEQRSEMAGRGREKVLNRFRFEDMVRSYEAIYGELEGGIRESANARSLSDHSHV